MKLKNYLPMMIVALFMAACSSSDDEDVKTTPAQDIAGVYTGNTDISVAGQSQGTEEEHKVTIEAQDNGQAAVTLTAFGSGAMAFGDVFIKNVDVSKQDGGDFVLSGTINTQSGSFTVTGDLEGSIDSKGNANLIFTMKPGAMPIAVVANFVGSK